MELIKRTSPCASHSIVSSITLVLKSGSLTCISLTVSDPALTWRSKSVNPSKTFTASSRWASVNLFSKVFSRKWVNNPSIPPNFCNAVWLKAFSSSVFCLLTIQARICKSTGEINPSSLLANSSAATSAMKSGSNPKFSVFAITSRTFVASSGENFSNSMTSWGLGE